LRYIAHLLRFAMHAAALTPSLAPFAPSAGWQPPRPRRGAALAVALVHGLALLLALKAGQVVAVQLEKSPVEVRLLDARAPKPLPPAPRPQPLPTLAPTPALVLPIPEIPAAAPVRELAATPQPAPPAAPVQLQPEPAPSRAITPPAPAPKAVAASSLRWRVEPAVELPRLSRRAGEQGRVQLTVLFDAEGRPQAAQLLRSSGFARLDAQAQEALRVARIHPYQEDGRAVAVSTVVTLEYELE
jgi:protein TonB